MNATKIGGEIRIGEKTYTVVGQDDGDLILMTTVRGAIREYRWTEAGRLVRIN